MKRDIVLISFPFTDFSGTKVRPAVVLIETEFDVTVAFITSQFKWKEMFDIVLEPSVKNGLKQSSLIRVTKLATIDKQLILGLLGELSASDGFNLNEQLKAVLKLY